MLRRLSLFALLVLPLPVFAGVNPKNGNFYITYTDVTLVKNDHEFPIRRTYNSKSVYRGWFGYGWGSPFETRLVVMPDHTAAISENGAGATSYFHDESAARDAELVAAGVARIVAAATAQDKLSPEAADALTQKLMGDEEARLSAVNKYGIQSELPRTLTLTAYGMGYCAGTLRRTDNGYHRDNGCGTEEDFDRRGNMVMRTQDHRYWIYFRIKDDHPVEIHDTEGQSIRLDWTQDGQVNRLVASDGTVVAYEYDDWHNLTKSSDPNGNAYRYDYDRNHNMTRIRYIDDSSMIITYSPNMSGMATSVTQRNGERTLYEYVSAPDDPHEYSTRIRNVSPDGEEEVSSLDFKENVTATGERNPESLAIHRDLGKRAIAYDEKGRIKSKKLSSGDVIAYTYDPDSGKVATATLNGGLTTRYAYNAAGDLVHAETSSGQSVDFEYNFKKKISRVYTTERDGSHSDLRFKYNTDGRPVEIRQEGFATVDVEYDDKGEISHVESDSGASAALHIMESFRTMMSIVELAQRDE